MLLLLVVVTLTYYGTPAWHFINVVLLIAVFVLDAIDGVVARKFNESSRFGAVFDIAVDRITELTLWVMFTALGVIGLWVPVVFIVRGVVTDSIRAAQVAESGQAPFKMLTSRFGKWLVAGRFMRGFYGTLKATTVCWLMLVYAINGAGIAMSPFVQSLLQSVSTVLVVASGAVCILRGLPVVAEFVWTERRSLLGSLQQRSAELH